MYVIWKRICLCPSITYVVLVRPVSLLSAGTTLPCPTTFWSKCDASYHVLSFESLKGKLWIPSVNWHPLTLTLFTLTLIPPWSRINFSTKYLWLVKSIQRPMTHLKQGMCCVYLRCTSCKDFKEWLSVTLYDSLRLYVYVYKGLLRNNSFIETL